MVPRHGSYGGEAIQALLDNITMLEFRGNLIVILGDYKEHIEELFEVNAGFRSRFDKKRLEVRHSHINNIYHRFHPMIFKCIR